MVPLSTGVMVRQILPRCVVPTTSIDTEAAMNFRKSLLAVLALCAVTSTYAAVDESARALLPDDIKQKGVLVVAMPLDFEPFNYLDEKNEQVGLDVDMIRAVGDKLGLKVDIQR